MIFAPWNVTTKDVLDTKPVLGIVERQWGEVGVVGRVVRDDDGVCK